MRAKYSIITLLVTPDNSCSSPQFFYFSEVKLRLLLIILLLSGSAFGQENTDTLSFEGFGKKKKFQGFKESKTIPMKQNVVKTGIVDWFAAGPFLFNAEFRVMYERMLAAQHSVLVAGGVNYTSPFVLLLGALNDTMKFNYRISGGRAQLAYRFYPIKKLHAPKGLYVGPHFSYNYMRITEKGTGDFYTVNHFFVCAVAGFQIVKKNGFSIDFSTGIGYQKLWGTYSSANSRFVQPISFGKTDAIPVKFMAQINIGYAF